MQPFEVVEYRVTPGLLLSTKQFCSLVDSMVFEVILFTEGRVREGAIGHYNATRIENFATRRSTENLIDRVMVEYARENFVFYDETIEAAAIEAATKTP